MALDPAAPYRTAGAVPEKGLTAYSTPEREKTTLPTSEGATTLYANVAVRTFPAPSVAVTLSVFGPSCVVGRVTMPPGEHVGGPEVASVQPTVTVGLVPCSYVPPLAGENA